MQHRRIYLTTPIAPEVAAAMSQVLQEPFGNPSSQHWAGLPAHEAVEKSWSQVAALLHSSPEEVVFASGVSESNNYALKGVFFSRGGAGAHIITTQIEHPAVLNHVPFS